MVIISNTTLATSPQSLTFTTAKDKILVAWKESEDNGGSEIEGYGVAISNIHLESSDQFELSTLQRVKTTSFVFEHLQCNEWYQIYVCAYNELGCSNFSQISVSTTACSSTINFRGMSIGVSITLIIVLVFTSFVIPVIILCIWCFIVENCCKLVKSRTRYDFESRVEEIHTISTTLEENKNQKNELRRFFCSPEGCYGYVRKNIFRNKLYIGLCAALPIFILLISMSLSNREIVFDNLWHSTNSSLIDETSLFELNSAAVIQQQTFDSSITLFNSIKNNNSILVTSYSNDGLSYFHELHQESNFKSIDLIAPFSKGNVICTTEQTRKTAYLSFCSSQLSNCETITMASGKNLFFHSIHVVESGSTNLQMLITGNFSSIIFDDKDSYREELYNQYMLKVEKGQNSKLKFLWKVFAANVTGTTVSTLDEDNNLLVSFPVSSSSLRLLYLEKDLSHHFENRYDITRSIILQLSPVGRLNWFNYIDQASSTPKFIISNLRRAIFLVYNYYEAAPSSRVNAINPYATVRNLPQTSYLLPTTESYGFGINKYYTFSGFLFSQNSFSGTQSVEEAVSATLCSNYIAVVAKVVANPLYFTLQIMDQHSVSKLMTLNVSQNTSAVSIACKDSPYFSIRPRSLSIMNVLENNNIDQSTFVYESFINAEYISNIAITVVFTFFLFTFIVLLLLSVLICTVDTEGIGGIALMIFQYCIIKKKRKGMDPTLANTTVGKTGFKAKDRPVTSKAKLNELQTGVELLEPNIVQGQIQVESKQKDGFGMCFSGGGVRAFSVMTGAIGHDEFESTFRNIDYLSCVSGGGYAGAALMSHGMKKFKNLFVDKFEPPKHLSKISNPVFLAMSLSLPMSVILNILFLLSMVVIVSEFFCGCITILYDGDRRISNDFPYIPNIFGSGYSKIRQDIWNLTFTSSGFVSVGPIVFILLVLIVVLAIVAICIFYTTALINRKGLNWIHEKISYLKKEESVSDANLPPQKNSEPLLSTIKTRLKNLINTYFKSVVLEKIIFVIAMIIFVLVFVEVLKTATVVVGYLLLYDEILADVITVFSILLTVAFFFFGFMLNSVASDFAGGVFTTAIMFVAPWVGVIGPFIFLTARVIVWRMYDNAIFRVTTIFGIDSFQLYLAFSCLFVALYLTCYHFISSIIQLFYQEMLGMEFLEESSRTSDLKRVVERYLTEEASETADPSAKQNLRDFEFILNATANNFYDGTLPKDNYPFIISSKATGIAHSTKHMEVNLHDYSLKITLKEAMAISGAAVSFQLGKFNYLIAAPVRFILGLLSFNLGRFKYVAPYKFYNAQSTEEELNHFVFFVSYVRRVVGHIYFMIVLWSFCTSLFTFAITHSLPELQALLLAIMLLVFIVTYIVLPDCFIMSTFLQHISLMLLRSLSKYSGYFLTDGGHFDNLGLYELLRRKCKTIYSIDAGADPKLQVQELTQALNNATASKIISNYEIIKMDEKKANEKMELKHIQKVTIVCVTYTSEVGKPEKGYIFYGKAKITEADTMNLQIFQKQQKKFPHHSTLNQFFTSELYRNYKNLGEEIFESIIRVRNQYFSDDSHRQEFLDYYK